MKSIFKITIIALLSSFVLQVQAQDVHALLLEGVKLNNAHNYSAAIEKYKAALNLEPDNSSANYQMAFSLNAAGKGKEALPFLQKVVQSNASAITLGSAFELMGAIYDQSKQVQKAIDSYQQGIKADSASYSLRYNLGLVYFRNHQYTDAEKSAVEAIKINPGHSDSFRLYALVTFHQDKRAAALLGFCRFLCLEPTGPRSAEAYGNIQHILKGGKLKAEPGVTISHHLDADDAALNQAITQAVATVAKRNSVVAGDEFSEQLKTIFTTIGQLAEKQAKDDFFHTYLAKCFYNLAQSPHVTAFAHVIRQSTDKTAAAWLKTHKQQVIALDDWAKSIRL